MFDSHSPESIIEFAKKLTGKNLRKVCGQAIENHGYSGKGKFGQLLEKFYFGYKPNSKSEADFFDAGIELKTSPLKILNNGDVRAKERIVLNIINYQTVYKENFETSSFWKKNARLLLVFYKYDKNVSSIDYLIETISDWQYSPEDLKIIRQDWEKINNKIKEGKAHELSEGDTFYLGACTKGSTSLKSYRKQPFSNLPAKQRAYSLKQGYVNHILASITQDEASVFGKIFDDPNIINSSQNFEEVVFSYFKPFYNLSADQIEQEFDLELNKNSKNYFANLTNAILGLELGQKIEEFEKANIVVKTIRIKENNLPKEHLSFPSFSYKKLCENEWENSELKDVLERKFFFVFYQFVGETLILNKVKFWNMPFSDILEVKEVWSKLKETVLKGEIVKEITENGVRKTFFPKQKDNRISHVRPHAKNSKDVFELPIADKLTGLSEYTKHSFWLNASYVRDEIFLKS